MQKGAQMKRIPSVFMFMWLSLVWWQAEALPNQNVRELDEMFNQMLMGDTSQQLKGEAERKIGLLRNSIGSINSHMGGNAISSGRFGGNIFNREQDLSIAKRYIKTILDLRTYLFQTIYGVPSNFTQDDTRAFTRHKNALSLLTLAITTPDPDSILVDQEVAQQFSKDVGQLNRAVNEVKRRLIRHGNDVLSEVSESARSDLKKKLSEKVNTRTHLDIVNVIKNATGKLLTVSYIKEGQIITTEVTAYTPPRPPQIIPNRVTNVPPPQTPQAVNRDLLVLAYGDNLPACTG